MTSLKLSPAIPDWMRIISTNAYIGSNEISEIFHINVGDVTHAIHSGRVPEPDRKAPRLSSRVKPKNLWKLATIRNFIAQAAGAEPQ